MAKITPARWRVMAYMQTTGCRLIRNGRTTGYTLDAYAWPVSTSTVDAMLADGLLRHRPDLCNEADVYDLSDAGRAALSDTKEAPHDRD